MIAENTPLLRAIWRNQLRNQASNIIDKAPGGRLFIAGEDELSFARVSAEMWTQCSRIMPDVDRAQLVRRIQRLCDRGHLRAFREGSKSGFFIPGPDALLAYEDARTWWIGRGFRPAQDAKGETAMVVGHARHDEEVLRLECEDYLLRRHAVESPGLFTLKAA